MKLLFLPLNYGDVIQTGMYDAFIDNGVELQVFDYFSHYEKNGRVLERTRNELIKIAEKFRPDILHLQIQHTEIIDGLTIGKIKALLPNCKIVNWTGDVRNYVPPSYKDIARYADFNLISSTGQISFFEKEIKKPVKYWQIGYNPKLYYSVSEDRENFKYDITFVANDNSKENYPGREERLIVIKELKKNFGQRFGLFGNNWSSEFSSLGGIDQRSVMEVYHNSFCVLSLSHYNDLSHYFSDRLLMCLASGRPTICYRFPNWESYFTNNSDIVIANSIQEIPLKVKSLLANRKMANFIGQSGAALAFSEHTYFSRVKELFEIIGVS